MMLSVHNRKVGTERIEYETEIQPGGLPSGIARCAGQLLQRRGLVCGGIDRDSGSCTSGKATLLERGVHVAGVVGWHTQEA